MAQLHKLPKIVKNPKKRLGRGHGSGRGKTSGRGTKGQKARENVSLGFEGGQLPLIKRLPLKRGKGRNKPINRRSPVIVNIKYLNVLTGTEVDLKTLISAGIVKADQANAFGVKILGEGELGKALTVRLPCSGGARKKIEKAGGKVIQ